MVLLRATTALLVAAGAGVAALTDVQHQSFPALPISGGSFLSVDSELPGPNLDDGTPTKLYSLSLGRTWHNHTASADLSAAVEAKKQARRNWQGRRSLYMSFEDTPLFPGWGTHFAYVYAGTPPQRVSVIIDTGSHFTAFPCSECKNCGSHTDPYWDRTKSSTVHVVSCDECHGSFRCQKNKRCGFSQRYSEGSSWSAYQVEDVLWVGELTLEESEKLGHDDSAYAVEFMFGCIESQTGLFKTQLADGIMGMSADSHTLVWQLAKAGKIKERTFSLCFGLNGGTMVIGGYDARLNKPDSEMVYTPSIKTSGWFTVKVLDITLDGVSIESDATVYQRGKGIIVDSGTTDTYLPRSVAAGFSDAWEKSTGSRYKTCTDNHFCMTLTPAELEALPTLTIRMDGGVDVRVHPEAYMDALGKDNAYAPRIYLTESMGGVLGANVMRDHNVVFDYDNHRIGFAEGTCDYKPDSVAATGGHAEGDEPSVAMGQGGSVLSEEANVDCVVAKEKTNKCDVKCPLGLASPQTFMGHEVWVDVIVTHSKGSGKECPGELQEELRECLRDCPAGAPNPSEGNAEEGAGGEGGGNVEGEILKVAEEIPENYCSLEQELWTTCSADCLQERYLSDTCDKEAEARPCHVGDLCSTSKAGLLLSVGLTLTVEVGADRVEFDRSDLWIKWVGVAIADAVAQLILVRAGNVEAAVTSVDPAVPAAAAADDALVLEAGASIACTAQVEMHLTPKVDNAAADRVRQVINQPNFPADLTDVLKTASRRHWALPGMTVSVVGAEEVSMFVASNGEAYLPRESNRLQSANPRIGTDGVPKGSARALAAGAMVVAAIAVIAFRVKQLNKSEGEGFKPVSQVEMLERASRSRDGESAMLLEGAALGRPLRRGVIVAREST